MNDVNEKTPGVVSAPYLSASDDSEKVVLEIRQKLKTGEPTSTTLRTDSRVLARITDGIYRSPTAAIRELVANAYDADAQLVTITSNPPWFDRIVVRDDGEGMDEASLVRLIKHIGGSSKRTRLGQQFGTTGEDPYISPGGRRLIGRIGIGLFSVAQMTRHFQIVTKRRGSKIRLFADVILETYNEDKLAEMVLEGPDPISTGQVTIQSYSDDDENSQGTDIVLLDLKREARHLLTSQGEYETQTIPGDDRSPFAYHIGRANPIVPFEYMIEPCVPWNSGDEPLERFRKLFDAVSKWSGKEKSRIEGILDRYLQMIWKLALSVPLEYLDGIHPFDLTGSDEPQFFKLSNEKGGLAEELFLGPDQSLRDALGLKAPENGKSTFRVVMDGVELRRPLRFTGLYAKDRPQDRPLLFVGSWSPSLTEFPASSSGGHELSLEGYLIWMPRVIPGEHAGLLTRIADASGILFDERFMDYPIAELTRLTQTTAELFVNRGLDAALNIDRESFNFGHPHAKLVQFWIHLALRQLATTQKRIAGLARRDRREEVLSQDLKAVVSVVEEKLAEVGLGEVPTVEISTDPDKIEIERRRGTLAYEQKFLLNKVRKPKGGNASKEQKLRSQQIRAIAELLEGYGAFQGMDFNRQQELLNGIARIMWGTV